MKFGTAVSCLVVMSAVALSAGPVSQKHPMRAPSAPGVMSKADWQKMYDVAGTMFNQKNADGLFSVMAPGFTLTMMGKTQNAAQAKAGLKQWFSMVKDIHCKMTVTKVVNGKGTATVVAKTSSSGHMTDPKTHKVVKFTDDGTETANWAQKNGKWLMQKLVISNEKMTADGKPMKMGG